MTTFDNVSGYPLSWPATQPRTRSRSRSSFRRTSVAQELEAMFAELGRLGCGSWDVIVSSNVELRQDGLPYSNRRAPDDPGVAVYFKLAGEPRVLACDRWDLVEHNLRAIVKHVEAMRGMERWGVGTRDQAFAGYKALPAPAAGRMWFEVLGFASEVHVEVTRHLGTPTRMRTLSATGRPTEWLARGLDVPIELAMEGDGIVQRDEMGHLVHRVRIEHVDDAVRLH
ncbi:MAG: hypothetical protein ACPGQD_05615, partial [Planctomycetota bacterium]